MEHGKASTATPSETPFRELWNTTPALRLAGTMLGVLFVWLIVEPLLPAWLLPNFIGDVLFYGAIVIGGTKLARSVDRSDSLAMLEATSWTIDLEHQVWPLSSSTQSEAPSPPPGYESPTRISSPMSTLQKIILAGTWTLVGLTVFAQILTYTPMGAAAADVSFSWPVVLTAFALVVVLHNLLYTLIGALLGHKITLGVKIPIGTYGRHSGKLQTRTDRFVMAILPVALVSALCVPGIMVASSPFIQSVGVVALLFTMVSSGYLVYSAVCTLRAPPGELHYSPEDRHAPTYVYEPTDASESLLRRLEKRVLSATDILKVSDQTVAKYLSG